MNAFGVFRMGQACSKQKQAGKQRDSKEAEVVHSVAGYDRLMTIGWSAMLCKAASWFAPSCFLISRFVVSLSERNFSTHSPEKTAPLFPGNFVRPKGYGND
jgi:hypothetical protein